MYVRDAKNRDEAWLLDAIEQLGLDDVAFRSRDYVIAVDEESGDRAGFGRLRLHRGGEDAENRIELTGIGVLPEWRGRGVGAHVVERLVDTAATDRFETVYVLTDQPEYLTQFGFERIDTDDLPAALSDRLAEKREFLGGDVVGDDRLAGARNAVEGEQPGVGCDVRVPDRPLCAPQAEGVGAAVAGASTARARRPEPRDG